MSLDRLRDEAAGQPVDLARAAQSDDVLDAASVLRLCRSKDAARAKAGRLRAAVYVWRADHGGTATD
jgi:hypothetical protein